MRHDKASNTARAAGLAADWQPPWLHLAGQDLGLRELPGAPTAPRIAGWLLQLGAWWRDDETPWCGTACAAWFKGADIAPPKAWYRALAWADWGVRLETPQTGAVVVFSRPGGGHVGLVVGRSARGLLVVRGGNQGDTVCDAAFDAANQDPRLLRVVSYRWPDCDVWPRGLMAAEAAAATRVV